jgi:hypothetical protein
MKVVINKCYGGFSVNKAIYVALDIEWDDFGYLSNEDLGIDSSNYNAYRSHPRLIAAVEQVGCSAASGSCAKLKIVEIPNGTEYEIDEYDGMESIHEVHRSWG